MKREDSPDFKDPKDHERKEWVFPFKWGPFSLIYWGMWRALPLWDMRISRTFFMSGPYELRWDRRKGL